MRLIDADSANERLLDFIAQNDSGIQFAIEHKDVTMLEDIFFDYFEGQPTACDVDKAVERLEHLIKKSYRMAVEGSHWAGAKYNAYREALEIVKAEIKKQEPEGGKKGNEKHADGFKQLFI